MELYMVFAAIHALIDYALSVDLLDKLDETYAVNRILSILKLNEYKEHRMCIPFPKCLNMLSDYAVKKGLIEDTVTQRDIFDTKIMGALTPKPSTVIKQFYTLYDYSSKAATDYFYSLSKNSNYIRRDRIAKDLHWIIDSKYGALEISINLSKPEKDPKDIASDGKKKAIDYPKCPLCIENEGIEGTPGRPARENHRIIPIDICGEQWGFQYSPYVYYNEHCIALNTKHTPMTIDSEVFHKLLAFVELFPHYFIGSNADLPIVGGSILSHEHFQGGCHVFPMELAETEFSFVIAGFEDVKSSVLNYPMTVIRLNSSNKSKICAFSSRILEKWREYTDEEAFIFAETNGEYHNTITPIARMNRGNYEIDLVLRNNITTAEHPLGVYHPHIELQHIKKENIGLIEVMGLAVLPGRLKKEMQELKEALLNNENIRDNTNISKHADWAYEFMNRRNEFNADNAERIIREEIGNVFIKVLECAGVYKCTDNGRALLRKFLDVL